MEWINCFATALGVEDAAEPSSFSDEAVRFYATYLRAALFTGFITLTGFLFAMKTFLIINLNKEVYEKVGYREHVKDMEKLMKKKLPLYAPLRRLAQVFAVSVGVSLATAILQFTIGLIPALWAVIACILFAIIGVGFLIGDLVLLNLNLRSWFEYLGREEERKHKEIEKSNEAVTMKGAKSKGDSEVPTE